MANWFPQQSATSIETWRWRPGYCKKDRTRPQGCGDTVSGSQFLWHPKGKDDHGHEGGCAQVQKCHAVAKMIDDFAGASPLSEAPIPCTVAIAPRARL